MLASHHVHSYLHDGHLYHEDKKHPGQYISEMGSRLFLFCGKLLTSKQIEKIEKDSTNKKTIEEIISTS